MVKLGVCPKCGSIEYKRDMRGVEGDFISIDCNCSKCGADFVEYVGLDEVKFTGTDEEEEVVPIKELMDICQLQDLDWNDSETEKRENTLSGGQKTRLKLAYSLNKILYHFRKNNTNPMIVILDEIDSGLKKGKMIVGIQKNIMKLEEFENTAIISIVHNPDCVEKLYNKCWIVNKRIVYVRK